MTSVVAGVCAVEGCSRASYCRGWCIAHYERWRRFGDTLANVRVQPRRLTQTCSVLGCDRRAINHRGWCGAHYSRWYVSGDVRADVPIRKVGKGKEITYGGAHHRVERVRGKASLNQCVGAGCARQADNWSYTYDCPNEGIEAYGASGPTGAAYCRCKDSAHYEPRCFSCHFELDRGRPDVVKKRWTAEEDSVILRDDISIADMCSMLNGRSPSAVGGRRWYLSAPPRKFGLSCSVDGCDAPALARGWCNKHWQRWRKHGDVNKVNRGNRSDDRH